MANPTRAGQPIRYYPIDLPSVTSVAKPLPPLKSGRTPGNTRIMNPPVRVVGDQAVLLATQNADKKHRQALRQLMQARAAQMQIALQEFAHSQYTRGRGGRAGSGRFARGIRVKGSTTEQNGYLEGKIHVSIPNYRETRFLTALGGVAGPPTNPYFITARGVMVGGKRYGDLFSEARSRPKDFITIGRDPRMGEEYGKRFIRDPITGGKKVAMRTIHQQSRKAHLPRLKVPLEGIGSLGRRGGAGRGKNIERVGPLIGGIPIDFDNNDEGFTKGEAYFYPIWVMHPGWPQGDVMAAAVQQLQNETIDMWKTLVLEYQNDVLERGGKTLRARVPGQGIKDVTTDTAEIEAANMVLMSRLQGLYRWRSNLSPAMLSARPEDL